MEYTVVVNQWINRDGTKKGYADKMVARFATIESAMIFVKTMFDNCDGISVEIEMDEEAK